MSRVSAYRRAYGQFFTPEPVVAGCYALLAGRLPPHPRIADPACGDGAFLRYAAAHELAGARDLYGCDVDASLAAELIGDGLYQVRCGDGLDSAILPSAWFDLVVGNPPFGIATTPQIRPSGLSDRRPPTSEVRFLLRALELARPGGHIALVLPNGVLANERLQPLRAGLLDRCTLLAVIALPRGTFRQAGTSAACSILLLRKAPAPPAHQSFFALAQALTSLPALVAAYRQGPTADQPKRRHRQEAKTRSLRSAGVRGGFGAHTGGEKSLLEGLSGYPLDAKPSACLSPKTVAQSAMFNAHFWLPQAPALAQRLDAHYWRPEYVQALERMAARHELRPLGELLDQRDGLIIGDHVRPSRGEARGAGLRYEYYQTREFMAAGYNYAAVERCDERAYRRLARTAVQQRDILVSCAGVGGAGQGRVCLITHRPGPSCTGDVFILRTRRPDPLFLFLFLGSLGGRAQLLRLQNGVGTVNLSADELLQVQVPLVALATQQAFAARYAPVAAAHDSALAARSQGDTAGFIRERARAEALLAELRCDLEALILGE
jgi:hypothetical protein